MGHTVTASWWRRNTVALLTAVVLIAVTFGTVGYIRWDEYWGTGRSILAHPAPGERMEIQGHTVGPATAEFGGIIVDDVDLPPDSQLVRVTVGIEPSGPGFSCRARALTDDATHRQWDTNLYTSANDPTISIGCDSEARTPYDVTFAFVVPEGVDGPFTLDFDVQVGEITGTIQLPVSP